MPRLILTGFMGCGKSAVGRLLSEWQGAVFTDTDEVIEQQEKRKISGIFESQGEEAFRDMETNLLKGLGAPSPGAWEVLSAGGGMPVREENRRLLKRSGLVVYLKCSEELLKERLKEDSGERPMLKGTKAADGADGTSAHDEREGLTERIRSLMGQREKLYMEAADIVVDEEGRSLQETAGLLKGLMEGRRPKFLIINGPNLNFLGIRDTDIYGKRDYQFLMRMIYGYGNVKGVETDCFQSNSEGEIIDRIQRAYYDGTDGIVINPGAYTHYSYAIRDALDSYHTIPKIEIHISDINTREEFRRTSVTAPVCEAQIAGHGLDGYLEAMDMLIARIQTVHSCSPLA